MKNLRISEEVKEAITEGRGVVALESTIISHGLPYPQNLETALAVEKIIRSKQVVPATIALLDGQICIGLSNSEIERLSTPDSQKEVLKVSRRDLAYAISTKRSGATTVAATMICAHLAGIRLFVTGGIGGVHREGESTLDISADLQELSKTDVTVICAGAKSILDIGRTLEVLETLGVPVVGYRTDSFPEFYCSGGKHGVDYRIDEAEDIAKLIQVKRSLGLTGGMVIAQPIPQQDAIDSHTMEHMVQSALEEAKQQNISGKKLTPYLLASIVKKSAGRSLHANISLIKNNAALGADIAIYTYN